MEAYWRGGGARQRVGEGMLGGGEVGGWTGGERCIAQMIVRRTTSSKIDIKRQTLEAQHGDIGSNNKSQHGYIESNNKPQLG